MLSTSTSTNLLCSRLPEARKNFESDPPVFSAPAIVIENGYEAIPVNFLVCPAQKSEFKSFKKLGSCFALLRKLLTSSQSTVPIDKESLITVLSRNSKLIDDLKITNYNNLRNNLPNFNSSDFELLISIENGPLLRVPVFDLAIVKQEDLLHICAALENNDERIFFQVANFSSELEGVLRSFMPRPQPPSNTPTYSVSFDYPILPNVDLNDIIIKPPTLFENFIDDSAEDYENEAISENNENLSQDYNNNNMESNEKIAKTTSKPKRSESSSKSPSNVFRQCLNCFCTATPMWRRGPDGTASLCNACGVKFKAGKLQMSPETVEENLRKINHNRLLSQQHQSTHE